MENVSPPEARHVKTLLFDIETTPNLAWVWDKYEQDVIAFVKERYLLCYSYQWLGEKTVHTRSLPDYRAYGTLEKVLYKGIRALLPKKASVQIIAALGMMIHDDKELVEDLWKLFDEADVIVAHNGKDFDVRMANAAFLRHGLKPPTPYKVVDTRNDARRIGRFNSNKLADLGNAFHVGAKMDTGGFPLWVGCMAGDSSAWRKMTAYNRQDISVLAGVYEVLRPWAPTHPNVNVLEGRPNACARCGHTHLQARGWAPSVTRRVRLFVCKSCGYTNRSTVSEVSGVTTK